MRACCIRLVGLTCLVIGFGACPPAAADVPGTFPTIRAVQEWAEREYFGGSEVYVFEHGTKKAIVVLGMRTSGLRSTEVLVLEARGTDSLGLILTRQMVPTFLFVLEDDKGLAFVDEDGMPVLVLPWNGVQIPFNPPKKTGWQRPPKPEPLPHLPPKQ